MLKGGDDKENDGHELSEFRQPEPGSDKLMEEEDEEGDANTDFMDRTTQRPLLSHNEHNHDIDSYYNDGSDEAITAHDALQRSTIRKLDWVLLPFLATLFLLNSLDKSNIGSAESAGFSTDTGLSKHDINTALAFFFVFFVALQPVGAALGRQFGMVRWVPACMSLWGLCTIAHIWVRRRWQLIVLRIVIASLEAGFYPTTVSYLSLFYTRYEFAVRLGIFYGQTAVAGVLGGCLSWAVFRSFPGDHNPPNAPDMPDGTRTSWRSWEVLFLVEGCMTIVIALAGFLWLPKSADSAWFFNRQERWWAEERIRHDQTGLTYEPTDEETAAATMATPNRETSVEGTDIANPDHERPERCDDQTSLLSGSESSRSAPKPANRRASLKSITSDSGLSRHEIASAILNYKIWLILICNILSAIPATAFGVFLPMVIRQLTPSLSLTPASSNLLSAPPFAFGAIVLFSFTYWSDSSRRRIIPILASQSLLLIGLTASVLIPMSNYVLRYLSLCILLSGSYVSSPLTVAWLSNNTPEPGKRAILLGINGWGNLAGVFSALLFTPEDAKTGYTRSFAVTLICVISAFVGFVFFRSLLLWENHWRDSITKSWTHSQREREEVYGDAAVTSIWARRLGTHILGLSLDGIRRGDEKLTYRYET